MQIKKIASFDVRDGASTVRYADLDDGISFFPTDGIINIKSNKVRIAGFGVDANSLYRINSLGAMYPLGDQNSVFLSNEGLWSGASIGGSSGSNKWVLAISDDFGVTDGGTLYARNANISGIINASKGQIAGTTITRDTDGTPMLSGGLIEGVDMKWRYGSGLKAYFHYTESTADAIGDYNQNSTGLVMAGAYGATIDLGMCKDGNDIDGGTWYSGVHLDGVSTIIRQVSNGWNRLAFAGGNSDLHSNSIKLRTDNNYINLNSDGSISMDANGSNPTVTISGGQSNITMGVNYVTIAQKDGTDYHGGPVMFSRNGATGEHSISVYWDNTNLQFFVDNNHVKDL